MRFTPIFKYVSKYFLKAAVRLSLKYDGNKLYCYKSVVTATKTIPQFTQNNFRSEKSNTKKNIDVVFALIQKMDESISEMKKEATEIAAEENIYAQTITEIENVRSLINSLISKINYTKI